MSRTIIDVPRRLMRVTQVNWWIDWRGQSAGGTNAGTDQVVYNRFPQWVGSPEVLLRDEAILSWRAVMLSARGRVGVFRVPLMDALSYAPSLHGHHPNGRPFSNDRRFSTGQGFAYVPFANVITGGAAGATELLVDDAGAHKPLRPGIFVSHDDWPYAVTSVVPEDGYKLITVEMPLRAEIPSGSNLDLDARGLFVAETDTMGNPEYGKKLRATPRGQFKEWLNR